MRSQKILKLAKLELAMFVNFGGKKTYLEANFEVPSIELASATIWMRLVARFHLSTRGAKTDFV